jgi:hypothetical protein
MLLCLTSLLLAAGCAEEPDPSLQENGTGADSEQRAGAETPATSIEVVFSDSGTRVSPLQARAGAVSFQIRNRSSRPHALAVRGTQEEWSSLELPADESVTMSIALIPGSYEVFCPLTEGGSHADRGERATLQVE